MANRESQGSLPSKYRLDLSYRGDAFVGFQTQPCKKSVQDSLEKALSVFFSSPIKVTGASRTDSGVHAEKQVAVFRAKREYDRLKWLRGFNALTPRSLGILDLRPVADDFHPIHCAKAKAYRYRIWLGNCWNPFHYDQVWGVHKPFNLDLFVKSANDLVGTFDFTSFCNTDTDVCTKTRTVLEVDVVRRGDLIDFWIVGEGFLKQMVRIIVGSLVDIAEGSLQPDSMRVILNARNRRFAGRTAPAQGLSLVDIFYDEVPSIGTLIKKADSGFSQSL